MHIHPSPLSVERCRPSAEHMRRHNTWLAPTMVIFAFCGDTSPRSAAILNRAKEHLTAFWNNVAPGATAASANTTNWLCGPTVQDTVGLDPLSQVGYLHMAQGAGRLMVIGIDVSGGGKMFRAMAPGWSAHEEMAIMAAAGLTPLAALQAGTINP